jgi:hypothetical protein
MFPNVRLLIGASLASVVALCCGFGIFAAFRVSHEPLGRLPANTAALQLVASETAGPPAAWGTALGSHDGVSDDRMLAAATNAPTPVSIRTERADPSSPWTTGSLKPEVATAAVEVPAPPPVTQSSAPSAVAAPPEPSILAARVSEPAMPPQSPANAPASGATLAAASNAEPPKLLVATTSKESASAANESAAAASTSAQQTSAAAAPGDKPAADASKPASGNTDAPPIAVGPAVAAIEKPPLPAERPAEIAESGPEAATAETNIIPDPARTALRKVVRSPVERRRVAVRRVIRRTSIAAVQFGYSNSAFHEPIFRSAPQPFQSPPATQRRTAIKTTPSTATSNSISGPVWPNVE